MFQNGILHIDDLIYVRNLLILKAKVLCRPIVICGTSRFLPAEMRHFCRRMGA